MKVLKEILVVILSVVSFISLICYLLLFSTENILSKKNIKNVIKQVEIKEVIGSDGIAEISKSLTEAGIPADVAENVLDNDEFKSVVGDYTSDILSTLIIEEETTAIDSKEFANDLNNVLDIVTNEAKKNGVEISDNDIKKAREEINKNSKEIVGEVNKQIVEVKESIKNDPENQELNEFLNMSRDFYRNKYVFLIITIVGIVLSCLLKIKEFKFIAYIRNIGISYGVILTTIGLTSGVFIGLILASIGEYQKLIENVVKPVPNTFIITGIGFIITGILALIGYTIIKKKVINKQNTEISSN